MADKCGEETQLHLVGFESWIFQMPRIDGGGDVFVSVPLPKEGDLPGEPPSRRLIALGDVFPRRDILSRLKLALEDGVIRATSTTTDPASILNALNGDLIDPAQSDKFATLLIVVIDGQGLELVIANAGHILPFIRRADRRVELLAEEVTGFPLGIVPEQTYENVTVPIDPGEVVVFYSDGVTAMLDHHSHIFGTNPLRQAIAQAPDGAASVGESIAEFIRRFGQGTARIGRRHSTLPGKGGAAGYARMPALISDRKAVILILCGEVNQTYTLLRGVSIDGAATGMRSLYDEFFQGYRAGIKLFRPIFAELDV